MTERITVLSIVFIVGILALLTISTTMAQNTGRLFVSGYINDNQDNGMPTCKSRMTAFAQPGNKLIGTGMVRGITYYIEFQPGWEQSSSIDFYAFDIGPILCTSIPTENFTKAVNGQISIDLNCQFRNFNCFYYVEYDHIEGQAEKYWSRLPHLGRRYR